MPSRRGFIIGLGLGLVGAMPVRAQDDAVTQSVLRQLEQQGFRILQVTRTLLGRVRIAAMRGELTREIVLDPRNGQIFRDLVTRNGSGPSEPQLPDYDDDYDDDYDYDDDDDDGDDDDDDDSSGSGGGNSGSGGGDDDDDDD